MKRVYESVDSHSSFRNYSNIKTHVGNLCNKIHAYYHREALALCILLLWNLKMDHAARTVFWDMIQLNVFTLLQYSVVLYPRQELPRNFLMKEKHKNFCKLNIKFELHSFSIS